MWTRRWKRCAPQCTRCSVSEAFTSYAEYYDLLYSDKDYLAEATYAGDRIRKLNPAARSVLELGSGTGRHAEHLVKLGFDVTGVDISPGMHQCALERKATLPPDESKRLDLRLGDLRTVRYERAFDAVLALFHVVSFQTTPADLRATFETAAAHLAHGGVFLFDFWFGPAVLAQLPEERTKFVEHPHGTLTRVSNPMLDRSSNTVRIDCTISVQDTRWGTRQIRESHAVRFWFADELALAAAGLFEVIATDAWLTTQPADEQSWSAVQVLVRLPACEGIAFS